MLDPVMFQWGFLAVVVISAVVLWFFIRQWNALELFFGWLGVMVAAAILLQIFVAGPVPYSMMIPLGAAILLAAIAIRGGVSKTEI